MAFGRRLQQLLDPSSPSTNESAHGDSPSEHEARDIPTADTDAQCPNCGVYLTDVSGFCPSCGEPSTVLRRKLEAEAAKKHQPVEALIARKRHAANVDALADKHLGTGLTGYKSSVSRELSLLPNHLRPNERVIHLARGELKGSTGLLAATDLRVIFFDEGWSGTKQLQDFLYEKITSVDSGSGGFGAGKLEILAAGGKVEIKKIVPLKKAEAIAAYVRNRLMQDRATVARPMAKTDSPPADLIDQLRRLGELHDAGVLTDEEFARKKASILERI